MNRVHNLRIISVLCFLSISHFSSVAFAEIIFNKFRFEKGPYAENLSKDSDMEQKFIARFRFHDQNTGKEAEYVFYANPTDARGYRSILKLVPSHDQKDMHSVYNRPYAYYEVAGLYSVVPIIIEAYKKLGVYAQVADLGNNAHLFVSEEERKNFFKDKATGGYFKGPLPEGAEAEPAKLPVGTMIIGSKTEPGALHVHFIGRGDPNHDYVRGVPLNGPNPGKVFQPRAWNVEFSEKEFGKELAGFLKQVRSELDVRDPGNMTKISWADFAKDTPNVQREKARKYHPLLVAFSHEIQHVMRENHIRSVTLLDSQ